MNWSSNFEGLGVEIVIANLERVISKYALCFEFPTINNEAKYEAIIVGLKASKELKIWDLKAYSNS